MFADNFSPRRMCFFSSDKYFVLDDKYYTKMSNMNLRSDEERVLFQRNESLEYVPKMTAAKP